MGRPRKQKTVKTIDENDQVVEAIEVGVPGLFTPQESDIREELQGNEALYQYRRELSDCN